MDRLRGRINDFDVAVLGEFVKGYAQSAGATIHLDCIRGDNPHHIAEAEYKAVARALRAATEPDPRAAGIPSTKGVL